MFLKSLEKTDRRIDNGSDAVLRNVHRLIKYYISNEYKDKNVAEIQNIQLEIQCSLNYTCPRCIKMGKKENALSDKLIEEKVPET